MREWTVVLFLMILECSKHPHAQERCPGFTIEPPARVVIPPGGGKSITCQYSQRTIVDWFKDQTTLRGTPDPETICYCSASTEGVTEGVLLNLTFMNFQESGEGMYNCGAQTSGLNFTRCFFEVKQAVDPEVRLDSSHVTPNPASIGSTITISPEIDFGIPVATILWSHSPDPPLNRTRVNVTSPVLVIPNVVSSDRGVYNVTASSQDGNLLLSRASGVVNVFVNFLELNGPTPIEDSGDSIIRLQCVATGYPREVTLTWSVDGQAASGRIERTESMSMFEKTVTSTLEVQISSCVLGTVYTCMARSGSREVVDIHTLMDSRCRPDTVPDLSPPTDVSAEPVSGSFTQIMVTWSHGVNTGNLRMYRVTYAFSGSSSESGEVDLPRDATSYLITGLMPNTPYDIRVGSVGSDNNPPVYADLVTASTPPCSVRSVEPMRLLSVSTKLDQLRNQRTINVSWTHPPDDEAIDYFAVNVQSINPSVGRSEMMVPRTETSFLLPTGYCNGSMYNITVYSVNQCGLAGPSRSVTQTCTVLNGNILTVQITSIERSSLGLQLSLNNRVMPADIPSIYVNATTIENSAQGTISISIFRAIDYPQDGFLCIGDLKEGTFYNVCVTPVLRDSTHQESACTQVLTASSGEGTLTDCALADSVVESTVSVPPAEFPDWAIAVIVVGALAVLAFIFCFIGLCFACNTGDNKDDDMASVSSLPASSIGPGSTGPYPNMRRNNMSPHRSCLSYHREGHSTNWNDHRDTLKQMETDIGTNV